MPLVQIRFVDERELSGALEALGADPRCHSFFHRKRETLCLQCLRVDTRAANALKQELLARGGDAAVHAHAIDRGVGESSVLLFGTLSQLRSLEDKLAAMPYWGLDALRRKLTEALSGLGRRRWSLPLPGGRTLPLGDRTRIMGILNLTPDSFHQESRLDSPDSCLARGEAMLVQGADVLDLGGESTRPGAAAVDPEEEIRRVTPAVRALRSRFPEAVLSVDTTKASVARACLEEGADLINDISGLTFDPDLASTVARGGAALVLMHIQGVPRTMQQAPHYENLLGEVAAFFGEQMARAAQAGLEPERVVLDPGFGFGKTAEHNLELLRHLEAFRPLGRPLLVGASRKSTLGTVLGQPDPADRLEATLAVTSLCAWQGVSLVRVHDVAENVRAARMVDAVRGVER